MRFVRTAENLFGLPLGFTRVEYLESSGTQYIDTGLIVDDMNYKFILNVMPVTHTTSCIFGAMNASSGYPGITINEYGSFRYGTQQIQSLNLTNNVRYKFELTYQKLVVNDTDTYNATGTTLTTPIAYNTYLFARNNMGTAGNFSSCRFYGYKVYHNDTLLQDFVPCLDKDGIPCMWNKVEGKAYYNQGTGTFTAGRKVIPVEYLESSGTQYIDTGVGGDLTTELTCEAAIVQAGNASVTNIMGNNVTSSRAITINMSANITNPSPSRIRFGNTDNTTEAGAIDLNTFYKYDTNKNGLTVRDGSGTVLNTYPLNATTAFTTNGNILIYKLGDTSTQYIGKIKVKSATIKNSGVLVRDLIPCKDENNVGFMFDKVSGTCYLNAGTGAFSVGENKYTSKLRLIKDAIHLPDGYKRVEYLESSGTQYIDTGYIPTNTTGVQVKHTICADNSTDNLIFGCRESSGDTRFWEDIDWTNTDTIGWGFNSYSPTTTGARFPISGMAGQTVVSSMNFMNNRAGCVNGVTYDTSLATKTLSTMTRSICLFAADYAGTMSFFTSCKIFSCQISEGSTLVRSFIPVRDENNVGYMFDEVTGQLFGNAGSGSFGIGNDLPTASVRFNQDVLPREYRPLKYLESTGTQYIDLGIHPTDTYGYRIKNTYTVGQGEQCAIGCMDSGNRFVGIYTSGSANAISGAWGSFVGFLPSYPWTTGDILDVEVNYKNSRKLIVGGTELKDISDVHISGTINNNLYLFARNYGSTVTKMYGKIYSVQVSNGQEFVLDLYPALRKSDNKPGMYDRITKQFFTNDATSGNDFNYG